MGKFLDYIEPFLGYTAIGGGLGLLIENMNKNGNNLSLVLVGFGFFVLGLNSIIDDKIFKNNNRKIQEHINELSDKKLQNEFDELSKKTN